MSYETQPEKQITPTGLAHLGVVYLVWSSTYLAIRLAVREGAGFPPFTMGLMRTGISAVILFAGLDIDVRRYGITGGEISRNWAAAETPSPFGEIAREGDFSKLPSAMATIYSNIDPSCCPEGKSVVATMVLAEPERFERALGPGRQRGRAYKELKKDLTAQLLEKMARALGIPDLEGHVEVLELSTPITIERYTENRGGSYVGWKYSSDQANAHFSQKSPVANLFLCGHWVAPGGGVSNVMTGGNNATEIADAYLRSSE